MLMSLHREYNIKDRNDHKNENDGDHRLGSPSVLANIHLSTGEILSNVNQIILATGFGTKPPQSNMIHTLAQKYNLPLSDCGYPIVNSHLQWKPSTSASSSQQSASSTTNIYVTGALADLELGPSARNIAGARMASERILAGASNK